jgi:hypothetical protein
MNKVIIALFLVLLLASCKTDSNLRKKIPGWYSYTETLENSALKGNITYYKNGEMKIVATYSGDLTILKVDEINITIIGTWRVEDGFLKEKVSQVTSKPKFIADPILKLLKKEEEENREGSEIIHVNKEELQLKTARGELTTYKRIKK